MRRSAKSHIRPQRVGCEFADLDLAAFGGSAVLARTAKRLGLFELLEDAVSVKVRNRGATDAETLWAIVASLPRGHGALPDLDALRADPAACALLGLRHVPDARRAGEWLSRLHATLLGGLRTAGQLRPGGGRVTLNWRQLFDWTAGMVPEGTPVWPRADNACRQGELVRLCAGRGWDHSISLTSKPWRGPVLEQVAGLEGAAWTDIGMEEEAVLAAHRPRGWQAEQRHVVIRRRMGNGQMLLVPRHTVMLASRPGLPVEEPARRHRGKRDARPAGRLENGFKGPLRDMGLHHPPCRPCRANQAFCALGRIAQVLPRAVRFTALPKSARRHGIRRVIRHVTRAAAHRARGQAGRPAVCEGQLPPGLAPPGGGGAGSPRAAFRSNGPTLLKRLDAGCGGDALVRAAPNGALRRVTAPVRARSGRSAALKTATGGRPPASAPENPRNQRMLVLNRGLRLSECATRTKAQDKLGLGDRIPSFALLAPMLVE